MCNWLVFTIGVPAEKAFSSITLYVSVIMLTLIFSAIWWVKSIWQGSHRRWKSWNIAVKIFMQIMAYGNSNHGKEIWHVKTFWGQNISVFFFCSFPYSAVENFYDFLYLTEESKAPIFISTIFIISFMCQIWFFCFIQHHMTKGRLDAML